MSHEGWALVMVFLRLFIYWLHGAQRGVGGPGRVEALGTGRMLTVKVIVLVWVFSAVKRHHDCDHSY